MGRDHPCQVKNILSTVDHNIIGNFTTHFHLQYQVTFYLIMFDNRLMSRLDLIRSKNMCARSVFPNGLVLPWLGWFGLAGLTQLSLACWLGLQVV